MAFIPQREGRIITKVFKSMGLERIHSRQLKDLADAPVGLLSLVVMKRGHRELEKGSYHGHFKKGKKEIWQNSQAYVRCQKYFGTYPLGVYFHV